MPSGLLTLLQPKPLPHLDRHAFGTDATQPAKRAAAASLKACTTSYARMPVCPYAPIPRCPILLSLHTGWSGLARPEIKPVEPDPGNAGGGSVVAPTHTSTRLLSSRLTPLSGG